MYYITIELPSYALPVIATWHREFFVDSGLALEIIFICCTFCVMLLRLYEASIFACWRLVSDDFVVMRSVVG